ncbi:MAG: hexosaminidase [Crocinitomicaceae bacterium]|jgi:hexosaminidase
MKNIFFVLSVLLVAIAKAQCPVIPTPSGYLPINGHFIVPDTLKINAPDMKPTTYDYLKKELAARSIVLFSTSKAEDLKFLKVDDASEHGYEMNVANNIVIIYKSHEGAFYAVNSLLQMIIEKDGKLAVQKCFINDEPRFDWRGLHLDVSRHFFDVAEVKGFIDLMALYKFNKFHWHLTDDQGWRIEIKKYPKLTSIGGFRDSTVIGHFSDSPRKYDTENYGGFYTQEEIKEVVAYANTKFITVVPEIEMPGHSRAALAAYPEFSCTGELNPVPGLWGVFDDVYCSKVESINFMKDILAEVLELFPSEYIHIGGDEAPKERWKECKQCQKVIKKNKLKDTHELQSYFIRQMDAFLTERGRKLIGWDEILEGGLSPNAAVMSWRGEKGGIEAAKQGHNVVMSPTAYCYFDYYQSAHDIEPLAIGGYLPLEKVCKYNPVPEELTEEQEKYILGGQANLWTEYMPTMDHVEYMAFPRALALMQSLWCVNKPDYQEFLNVYLNYHEDYLALHDVNFSKSIHYPELLINRSEEGLIIQFKTVNPNDELDCFASFYSDGNVSSGKSRMRYLDSIYIKQSTTNYVNTALYFLTSQNFQDTLHYTFHITPDLGREIKLITPPHPKYDHNGSLNLVDGIRGGETFKGNEWLGFRENHIEMIVDMDDSKEVNGLKIGFKYNNGSWIYLPEKVTLYASDDSENWKEIGSGAEFKDRENQISFPSTKSKFIKLVIKPMDEIPAGNGGAGSVPWTFIDEIEFLRTN